jgi:DNA-binding GntR family transcriptional regulator
MSLVRVNRMRRLLEYRAKINRSRLQVQCSDHLKILEALERNELLEASYLMKQHLGGALEHKSPVNWSKLGPATSLSG